MMEGGGRRKRNREKKPGEVEEEIVRGDGGGILSRGETGEKNEAIEER